MAARVKLREITNDEGNRLFRMVRRTSGSVVTWRRAQIVLLSAQGMAPTRISEVVFTDPDTVRDVIHNFNRDGFDSLYPRYAGGRPRKFTAFTTHTRPRPSARAEGARPTSILARSPPRFGAGDLAAMSLYPIGFIAAIIGRAQLFTANTVHPVVFVLEDRRYLPGPRGSGP
jgi:hypothetical protein